MDIAILGAGTLAEFIIDIMDASHDTNIIGVYDDKYPDCRKIASIPVLGKIKDVSPEITRYLAIGIGEPSVRESLYIEKRNEGFQFPAIIHPSCVISKSAQVLDGVTIGPFSTVLSNSIIGEGACLLSHVNVNHYVSIDSFALIGAGVIFGNKVQVGRGAHISMGKHLKPNTTVEAWAYVE